MFWTSPLSLSLSRHPSSTSSLFLETRICCISLSCSTLFHLVSSLSRSGHSLRRPTRHNSATHPACFYPASPPSPLQDHLSPIWFELGALDTVRGVSDHGQVVSSTSLSLFEIAVERTPRVSGSAFISGKKPGPKAPYFRSEMWNTT